MTAAIEAQIAAAKAAGVPRNQRTPPTQGKAPPTEREPTTSPQTPQSPDGQHYPGRYSFTVACGTHYPGRMRGVVTGPADAGLVRAVVAAIEAYEAGRP